METGLTFALVVDHVCSMYIPDASFIGHLCTSTTSLSLCRDDLVSPLLTGYVSPGMAKLRPTSFSLR